MPQSPPNRRPRPALWRMSEAIALVDADADPTRSWASPRTARSIQPRSPLRCDRPPRLRGGRPAGAHRTTLSRPLTGAFRSRSVLFRHQSSGRSRSPVRRGAFGSARLGREARRDPGARALGRRRRPWAMSRGASLPFVRPATWRSTLAMARGCPGLDLARGSADDGVPLGRGGGSRLGRRPTRRVTALPRAWHRLR